MKKNYYILVLIKGIKLFFPLKEKKSCIEGFKKYSLALTVFTNPQGVKFFFCMRCQIIRQSARIFFSFFRSMLNVERSKKK